MGLGITVGILADQIEHDQEGADWHRHQFAAVNAALLKAGIAEHIEPENCEIWSAEGYGYSGLFALLEVAGRHWLGEYIPRDTVLDGNQIDAYDRLFKAGLAEIEGGEKPSLWQRITGNTPVAPEKPPFMHLVCHSDNDGYYLPIDFQDLVWPAEYEEETSGIWPLASVMRLQEDLEILANVLEIPADLRSDNNALLDLLEGETSEPDGPMWQAQPIAAYTALILREACAASLLTGAAISYG